MFPVVFLKKVRLYFLNIFISNIHEIKNPTETLCGLPG